MRLLQFNDERRLGELAATLSAIEPRFAKATLAHLPFPAGTSLSGGDSLVVPLFLVVSDPAEWDRRRRHGARCAAKILAALDSTLAEAFSFLGLSDLPRDRLVFFQLGDYAPTLTAWEGAQVFKNSARRGTNDLSMPYIVGEDARPPGRPLTACRYDVSFRGATFGVPVRQRLAEVFARQEAAGESFHFEEAYFVPGVTNGLAYREEYFDLIDDSRFVACPRGTGLGSYRLFETLMCGRIPIVIADDYEMPLEKLVDFSDVMMRCPEDDLENLPDRVREFAVRRPLQTVADHGRALFRRHFAAGRLPELIAATLLGPLAESVATERELSL